MTETGVPTARGQRRTYLFAVGAVMIVLAVLSVIFLNPSSPDSVCAPASATETSRYVDEEKGCPITIESFNEIREAESGLRWGNIIGLVLILGGLGVAAFGLRRKRGPAAG